MSPTESWLAIQAKWNISETTVDDHLLKTNQHSLPQAALLKGCLGHLQRWIEEAYLRGSFSLGEADVYSDVDLFLVVTQDKLEAVYSALLDYLGRSHSVLVSCRDSLVQDFGGVGYTFLLKDDNDRVFQVDLYVVIKGVPPKSHLRNCARVYSSNPGYCWLGEAMRSPLSAAVGCLVDRGTRPGASASSPRIVEHMMDLMVTLFAMKKHLARGQHCRVLNDKIRGVGICIGMLRLATNRARLHNTALYDGDRLFIELRADNALEDVVDRLDAETRSAPSSGAIGALYHIGRAILRRADPELVDSFSQALGDYERLVINC